MTPERGLVKDVLDGVDSNASVLMARHTISFLSENHLKAGLSSCYYINVTYLFASVLFPQ